jgi:hypothetical protein
VGHLACLQTYPLLLLLLQVPDLDCKQGQGVRRLDRYDQLSAYLLVRLVMLLLVQL